MVPSSVCCHGEHAVQTWQYMCFEWQIVLMPLMFQCVSMGFQSDSPRTRGTISRFPETGYLSLVTAMAMGAIPITSRFPRSILPGLTSEWDMGPRQALASHFVVSVQYSPEAPKQM